MQSFTVWMMNGTRDRREGDDAKSDESLEGAEGNGDNIGIFVERRMKTGRMRLYCMPVICRDKSESESPAGKLYREEVVLDTVAMEGQLLRPRCDN